MIRYLILAIRYDNFDPAVIEPHKQYLATLKNQGKLDLSGPFTDKSGGAYTILAENYEAAKNIAFNDPLYTYQASDITVYEWDIS
mgnify:CR=1 FL=1